MAKRPKCEAITKKGKPCKNRSIGDLRCHVHQESIEKKSALKTIGSAVKVTTTTASAIKLIYEVLQFLIEHWPEINRFFHGLDTNSYINYWHSYKDDCRRIIKDSSTNELQAHDLVVEFNSWFPTLPLPVQKMLVEKFGGRINRIRKEGTS
jgi:hypothetical protein